MSCEHCGSTRTRSNFPLNVSVTEYYCSDTEVMERVNKESDYPYGKTYFEVCLGGVLMGYVCGSTPWDGPEEAKEIAQILLERLARKLFDLPEETQKYGVGLKVFPIPPEEMDQEQFTEFFYKSR